MALTTVSSFATSGEIHATQGCPLCVCYTTDIGVVSSGLVDVWWVFFNNNPEEGEGISIDGELFTFSNAPTNNRQVLIGTVPNATSELLYIKWSNDPDIGCRYKFDFLFDQVMTITTIRPSSQQVELISYVPDGDMVIFRATVGEDLEYLPNYVAELDVEYDGVTSTLPLTPNLDFNENTGTYDITFCADVSQCLGYLQGNGDPRHPLGATFDQLVATGIANLTPKETYLDTTEGRSVTVFTASTGIAIHNAMCQNGDAALVDYIGNAGIFSNAPYSPLMLEDFFENPVVEYCPSMRYPMYQYVFAPAGSVGMNYIVGATTELLSIPESGVYAFNPMGVLSSGGTHIAYLQNPFNNADLSPRITYQEMSSRDERCCCGGQLFFLNELGTFSYVYVKCPNLINFAQEVKEIAARMSCSTNEAQRIAAKRIDYTQQFEIIGLTQGEAITKKLLDNLMVSPSIFYFDAVTQTYAQFANLGGDYTYSLNTPEVTLALELQEAKPVFPLITI